MTNNAKSEVLRLLCWILIVIIPTGIICWLMDIYSIAALGIALPFILMAEHVYRKVLQYYGLWAVDMDSAALEKKKIKPRDE